MPCCRREDREMPLKISRNVNHRPRFPAANILIYTQCVCVQCSERQTLQTDRHTYSLKRNRVYACQRRVLARVNDLTSIVVRVVIQNVRRDVI